MAGEAESDIDRALDRFAAVMGSRHPDWFAQLRPGLDDAGMQRLGEAVAPLVVPTQVRALYRRHDGGDAGVFGGWRMRPLDELLDWYRFTRDDLQSPPAWLPVFDDQMVNVVTLDLPGLPPSDPSVWYGDTHDVWLERLFDSIAAMLDVVCDAAEDGVLGESHGMFGLLGEEGVEALPTPEWTPYRLARGPSTHRYPDPPPGSCLVRSPDGDWPAEWLLSVGVSPESLALRGATHSVAELVAAAAAGPTAGTIRGRVVTGAGGLGFWNPVVDDGTARIVVACDTRAVPIAVSVGQEGEFDVLLETAVAAAPSEDGGSVSAAMAEWLRPALPTAKALAARVVPAG